MIALSYELSTWPRRVGLGLVLPLALAVATFVVLRVVRPTRELRCSRATVGAPASCELRERSTSAAPDSSR